MQRHCYQMQQDFIDAEILLLNKDRAIQVCVTMTKRQSRIIVMRLSLIVLYEKPYLSNAGAQKYVKLIAM